MSVHASRQFHYEAMVNRSAGAWRGRAGPHVIRAYHPGWAGDEPLVDLSDGLIRLTCTKSFAGLEPHGRYGIPLGSKVSFHVGQAPETVLADGDVLRVSRGGTTDLGVAICRQGDLVMGLGAFGRRGSRDGFAFAEDPRAHALFDAHLARQLASRDTVLLWLNADDLQAEAVRETFVDDPMKDLVIAVAGNDPRRCDQMMSAALERIMSRRSSGRSCSTCKLEGRFSTREQWLEYLAQVPTSRPTDLHVRFTIGMESHVVEEGKYAFHDPWHLFVHTVLKDGIPGRWSQLGVAKAHPELTRAMLVDSTGLVASRRIREGA